MKLYHGTNGLWVPNILKRGLEPRGNRQSRNNWKHVKHQSNAKCVYLTDSYAPHFALNAMRGKNKMCAVIEVDSDRLDPDNLFADEDCLEQVTRGTDDGCPVEGMSARTLWYRSKQRDFDMVTLKDGSVEDAWRFSLKALGTCAHWGTIPTSAITRVARWPFDGNAWLALVFDPTITLMNQSFCGDRYRALMAKLFGDTWKPFDPWFDVDGNPVESGDERVLAHFDPAKIAGLEIIRC